MLYKYLLFYILISLSSLFIFSFLFSLTLRFPLSSPCTGSLPLRSVRDVYRQRRRCSSDDDDVAPTTTATLDLAPATQSRSIHSISPTLDLADLTHAWSRWSHPEAAVDLTLSHAPATLPLSGCGFFFFFSLQFGLIWWWCWVVGCGRWQWQWWLCLVFGIC